MFRYFSCASGFTRICRRYVKRAVLWTCGYYICDIIFIASYSNADEMCTYTNENRKNTLHSTQYLLPNDGSPQGIISKEKSYSWLGSCPYIENLNGSFSDILI